MTYPHRSRLGAIAPVLLIALSVVACAADPGRGADRFTARAEQHANAGRFKDAAIEYRNALQWSPRRADIHSRLARVSETLGDRARADASFIDAAELDPGDLEAQRKASDALLDAGRPRDAERLTGRALAQHRRHVPILVLHARASVGIGQLAAERDLREALAIDSQSPAAHLILGVLRLRQGDVLTAARTLMPAKPLYHYHLGMAYAGAGRFTEARAALEGALTLAASFDGADEARRTLQTMP